MPMAPGRDAPMVTDAALYRLMTWLSPAFPVGCYSYSHGLETAIYEGLVVGAGALESWIDGILAFGALRVDGALLRLTRDAVAAQDEPAFFETAELADTLRATSELALESAAQGRAFLDTVGAAWPSPSLERWRRVLSEGGRGAAHPVAVGLAAAVAGVPGRAAVMAWLHAGVANLVSAGVRHIPLGQTKGQRIMANLESGVAEATEAALVTAPQELGTATVSVDWCSARHETQHVRLFRS